MKRLYPDTKYGVGPAIEEGFYYDFSVSTSITLEDLPKIEAKMKEIVKENISINHYYLSKAEAKEKFKNDKFKCELIDAVDDDKVGIYEQGDYADVCRGPHVISTGVLKHFKLEYAGLDSFSRAIITSGGISVKELNPKTMEVKKIPGLFFVGETINIDAFTGGFNMQIALSCGASCGDYLYNLENK